MIADLYTAGQLGVKSFVMAAVIEVDEDAPPGDHSSEEIAERVVWLGRYNRCKVRIGLVKAEVVNQVYAELNAFVFVAQRIG